MAKREGTAAVPLSRLGVLVAQLESIAASARQQPPDPLLCFDLLSELVSAIDEEPKEAIIPCQRKCEDALYSLLILGAQRPVRRLSSLAMARVIAKGDTISIYSRVSSLQGWLADGKRSEPLSCAGAAQCLGELYHFFGRRITSGLTETATIAAKLMKFHEDFVRQDALQMLCNAIEGSAGGGAPAAYSEAFRVIMRLGLGDKVFIVRLAAAKCLAAFANIGGPGLGASELESAASYCVKTLEDPVLSVRDAFAEALGALLALGMNTEAQARQRGKNSAPVKKLEGGLQKHLVMPFIRASGVRAKELRIGLTLSWVFYLQVVHLKYGLPHGELQNFALQAMDMLKENLFVDAHALACVLYIIRVGVTDQMSEPVQRSFLILLARQLECSDYSPSKGIAILRILSYLLEVLGEVPAEFKEVLDDTVVAALSHSSLNVRIEAALTLRGLAEVDPICVGGLISYGVATLYALRESASFEKGIRLKVELDSLHGQATVLAALVSISPRLLLGYPARLPKSVFDVSKKMLTEYSRNPVVASVEKEAGWQLLASLLASMPKEELEDQVFDILLLWTGFLGKDEIQLSEDLISEIRVLSAAIEALTAFIRSFLSPTATAINGSVLLQPVLFYLNGALSYISLVASKQLENIKTILDLFTIRTLKAYTYLSDPMSYKSDHPRIIQICTFPFRDPSGCVESSCLRLLLDKKDACLGPWMPGRDLFEDKLRAFEGGKDGSLPCVWENQISTFPQPESISKMLVNQMLLCFGSIFAIQDSGGKLLLLNMIDQCLKSGKKQSWHATSVTNACVGLLAGLKIQLSLRTQSLEIEILSSIQEIFQSILAEGEICAAQRRASSEGFGLLARLGSDAFTARMTRALLGELVSVTDPCHAGSLAFSLGCIHRSAGGMALSTLVPATVNSVSLLAKSSNAVLQQWSLHALLLTIEAAGLSYVSQVQATLFLAMEILLSEESGRVDLRQGVGRLINAIVAVLGPELSPGSTFFSRCKSVVAETSSGLETSTLLECVRFTQQLVLFAPQAVSVHSHVQTLLLTLSSRQPALRHLAVSTLQHLIEKDPVAIIDERIEENLFSMLDEETDPEIGNLVRTTINRLLYVSCPARPSRWLMICRNMILTTSLGMNAAEDNRISENDISNSTSETDANLYHGEDDENMIAGSNAKEIQSSAAVSASNPKRDKNLRYRTRVFAAECLSHLPMAVGNNPAHFDLTLARSQQAHAGYVSSRDWLVLHLQALVSLAYQISTSQFEGMQPLGVGLLVTIMDKFEKTPDPELPGNFLVEQYQAQFVSAIRSSVILSSSPLLLEAGLQLAAKVLTSSIMNGDRVALQRMFSLISHLLDDFKDLYYPSFAEWVACKIKIRLLAAHASIKSHVYMLLMRRGSIPDEYLQLVPLFSQISGILGKYWISVLKDYCFICFSLQSKSGFKPFLDGIQSLFVSSKVRACLDEAWLLILQASALDAVPSKFEMKKDSQYEVEDSPRTLLSSGYTMIRLEPRDFQFLWGLALLVLFQGQHSTSCSQAVPLLYREKAKNNEGKVLEETHDEKLSEVALLVFQALSTEAFFSLKYLSFEICRELLQVLLHADRMSDSWDRLAIPLLSQIVQFCPDDYFEMEDFISMTTELCVKYLHRTFQRNNCITFSQHHLGKKETLSILFVAAEKIVNRLDYIKFRKLLLAFLSASYECIRRSATDSCLSKLVMFLRNIFPLLTKYFDDDAEFISDDAHTVLGAWVTSIAHVSQDCMTRMNTLGRNNNDSSKLLAKKLAFCLEEAVCIARLAHMAHSHGHINDKIFFCSLYKSCIKCIQMTISDINIQVQSVGVHVLKQIAQKEGTDIKDHSFFLFFVGEILGDIFILIQKILMEPLSRESVAILDECLRFLFLFHTLSQASNCLPDAIHVLLEAILMVFSASDAVHSQELFQIKNVVMVLISHLVQIPSSAIQIKEILLSMPIIQRQRFQDIIRASTTQGQNEVYAKPINPSPIIKLPVKPEPVTGAPHPTVADTNKKEGNGSDDDDDWDAFQSFPTSTGGTDLQPNRSGAEHASTEESSILESGYKHKEHDKQKESSTTALKQLDAQQLEDGEGDARVVHGNELTRATDLQPADEGVTSTQSATCAKNLVDNCRAEADENKDLEAQDDIEDFIESPNMLLDNQENISIERNSNTRSDDAILDDNSTSFKVRHDDVFETSDPSLKERSEHDLAGADSSGQVAESLNVDSDPSKMNYQMLFEPSS